MHVIEDSFLLEEPCGLTMSLAIENKCMKLFSLIWSSPFM